MRRAITLVLLAAGLATACERGPDPAEERALVGRALRGVVAYPGSAMVSFSAGEEAAQVVFSSPDSVGEVATWFRLALAMNGWEIDRDHRDAAGAVTILAQQGERPLWITLRPNVGGVGTTYTMVGAFGAADSANSAPAGGARK